MEEEDRERKKETGMISSLRGLAPFAAMVFVEFGEVGMLTFTKASMNAGISTFVYLVYYNSFGLFLLFPFFLYRIYRNKQSDLSFPLLFRFFLLGLFGRSLLLFGYTGIRYTSPALAAAINNLVPVFTFMLAIIFKTEKMDMKNPSSVAKFLGTIIAVSGALVDTLYKGPPIIPGTSLSALDPQALAADESKWALGGLLLGISAFSIATWNILQAATVKLYPERISVVFFFSLFGTLQCAVIAFIVEKDPNAWIIPPGIPTFAIIYAGAFGIAIRFNIITWCLHEKGPLFVTMFKPLGMVIAVISGMILLGDALYLGSVIGAAIIAFGFYMVMWGQSRESIKVIPSHSKERIAWWKKLSLRWNRKAQM